MSALIDLKKCKLIVFAINQLHFFLHGGRRVLMVNSADNFTESVNLKKTLFSEEYLPDKSPKTRNSGNFSSQKYNTILSLKVLKKESKMFYCFIFPFLEHCE